MVLLVVAGVKNIVDVSLQPVGAEPPYEYAELFSIFMRDMMRGCQLAACATVASFVSAPLYLLALRKRDRASKDTSGLALRAIAQFVALALFVVLAAMLLVGLVG